MRILPFLLLAIAFVPACDRAPADSSTQMFVPVTTVDPSREAAADLAAAMHEASRTGRRVLVEVGGEWCSWCRRLDDLFTRDAALGAARDRYYVAVKINWSVENRNEEVLSSFPKIPGYPHFFVLAPDGTLLHSQDTAELESGDGHDPARVLAFLKRWAG
jgi:thiol:disulfide interchange protein